MTRVSLFSGFGVSPSLIQHSPLRCNVSRHSEFRRSRLDAIGGKLAGRLRDIFMA